MGGGLRAMGLKRGKNVYGINKMGNVAVLWTVCRV